MLGHVIHIFDLFGTAVFAVTGALCGVHKRLDLLGVVVFGCTVGVGGGILRDVIIGAVPVAALQDMSYLLICIISALTVFCIARHLSNLHKIIAVCDAIGLGVFTAIGAAKGCAYELNTIGIILCGVLTAVGGGILRDVMAGSIPVVLTSDFYATAALLGGGLFCLLEYFTDLAAFNIFISVFMFVTGIRLAAMHYNLQLPVACSADHTVTVEERKL
ncbi:MAG: trimeric intracellular cation channel family protein [Lentisphaerae bacterium]|nr:trimeric intracellular cation channel family protein [Lentisphaerota bacterium]